MQFSVSNSTDGEYVITATWFNQTIKTKEILRSQDEVIILPLDRGFFIKDSSTNLLTLHMPIYYSYDTSVNEPIIMQVMNNIKTYELKDEFILINKSLSKNKTCYYCFSLDPFNTITTICSSNADYKAIVENRVANMPMITWKNVVFNEQFDRKDICVLKSKRINIFVKNASNGCGEFGVKHYYFNGIVKPLSENYFTFRDKAGVRVSNYFFNIEGTKTKYSLKELKLDVFAEVIDINEIFDKESDMLSNLGGEGWYATDKDNNVVEIRHRNIDKLSNNFYREFVYKAPEPLKDFGIFVHKTSKENVYSYELKCMPINKDNFTYIICEIEGARFRIEL